MDIAVFCLFCVVLIGCVAAGLSTVWALLAGLLIFLVYGRLKGFGWKQLAEMCLTGVRQAVTILIMMMVIGVLTAVWRASGCIPTIVCYVSALIHPSVFILLAFLFNALVSFLTGTSFGTAATMGVICMSIANSMGIPVLWSGGAILSGIFFGDRCSPVSTSALLVCTLTDTDIYSNMRVMVKTSVVPFALTCVIYAGVGFLYGGAGAGMDVRALFGSEFAIRWVCLLPAAVVLILAICHVNVIISMLSSIAVAVPIALFLQKLPLSELLMAMLTGYRAASEELQPLINGGGALGMVETTLVVAIASCYSGIFKETGLLSFLQRFIDRFAKKCGIFRVFIPVALVSSMLACNQTLGTMLTNQLTADLELDRETRASYLENTAVLLAAVIPWCIADRVPLATIGAPSVCILTGCYLYLVPLWNALLKPKEFRSPKPKA